MKTTTKQFQILTDINLVWDFFVETYDREKSGRIVAPFFEYAILSSWMDNSYSYLNRFWFDGNKVVAFVFYESPVTDTYIKVRQGYEFLADEIVDYAINNMPDFGKLQFMLFDSQEYLMEAVKKRGFKKVFDYEDRIFDFSNELNFKLPQGYHFVEPSECDPVKLAKCCWYGFDHGEKGPFENWDKLDDSLEWTPAKAYKGIINTLMAPTPHATPELNVIIADENDEYVCFSGMWWVPENKLAYMEPLCTVPEHRGKGLARAALSKHYYTMKKLGATHMTGGGDAFYEKLGFGKGWHWNCYGK